MMSERLTQPRAGVFTAEVLIAAGGLLLFLSCMVSLDRAFLNLLGVSYLALSAALGGTFLMTLARVTGAGWLLQLSGILRYQAQWFRPTALAFFLVLLVVASRYPAVEPESSFRALWLNPAFLLARSAAYLLVWSCLAARVARASEHGTLSFRLSTCFLLVFAPTFWLAGVDWVMAQGGEWGASLLPLYLFAGFLLTAVTTATGVYIFRAWLPGEKVNLRLLADLAKLLFLSVCIWLYFWFNLYLLIWYAGIPSEAVYFLHRTGDWLAVFWLNPILNSLVPFLVLLSRRSKLEYGTVLPTVILILVGRWLDGYQVFLADSHPFQLGLLILDLGPPLLLLGVTWRFGCDSA